MKTRIVYYIVQASAQENQDGTHRFSKPYFDMEEARQDADKTDEAFVAIETHREDFKGYQYKPEFQWELNKVIETESL